MSTTLPHRDGSTILVDIFKGVSWEECDQFIRAIRISAFKEGKQRDTAWMADFAALHFSQAALSWHSRLPQDIRQDWSKLETALLDRWPSPEGVDGRQIEPTPVAAPVSSPNNSLNADRPLQGILKVLPRGSHEQYYLKFGSQICSLTRDITAALRVRCTVNSLGTTSPLELFDPDGSSHSWLAVGWREPNTMVGKGSKDFSSILTVGSDDMQPSWKTTPAWQTMTCSVSADGELNPIWKIGTNRLTLDVFVNFPNLRFVADPEMYCQNRKKDERATLIIEPVD